MDESYKAHHEKQRRDMYAAVAMHAAMSRGLTGQSAAKVVRDTVDAVIRELDRDAKKA